MTWPASAAAYRKDVAGSRAKFPLTAGMPRNAMPCAAWPYEPREEPVRITGRGPSNILLIQNERDVATGERPRRDTYCPHREAGTVAR